MKRKFYYLFLAGSLLFAACSNPEKMKDAADQIKAASNPVVLEARGGVIKSSITVTFPDKYFHPKAVLEMLPVMKYEGGEIAGPAKMLQGEDVKENNQTIAKTGGSYKQDLEFAYTDAMKKSGLYLRPTLIIKGNRITFPIDIKVADGVIATYTMAQAEMNPEFAADKYQQVMEDEMEAQILYVINQANVRTSELSKAEIKELEKFIADAAKQSRKTIKEIGISSYASPDGPEKRNETLSAERGKSSNDALNSMIKKSKLNVDKNVFAVKHTAEDWEGFQELMQASNIQDKDLVLRVLSMYSDSEVREREIKNISKVFKVIADEILPQLRRSKLTAIVEETALTDDELKAVVNGGDLSSMSLEQLLYSAGKLYSDDATRSKLYAQAMSKYANDYRAFNNQAAILLKANKPGDAKALLAKASALAPNDVIVKNNQGYVALAEGNTVDAEKLLSAAGLDKSKAGLGYLAIMKGDYNNASTLLAGTGSYNEGLAALLNNRLDDANNILSKINTAKSYYLQAVVAARGNKVEGVITNYKKATDLDASLKDVAKKDAELSNYIAQLI